MTNTNKKSNKEANPSVKQYDIIIVGGGMVGATLACALAKCSLKIAVVEAQQSNYNWPEKSHDNRVSALTHASQNIFENLGVWSAMQNDGVAAYNKMHVWDSTGQGQIYFDSIDVGQVNLGHIVENRVIQKALQLKLADYEHIELLMPLSLSQVDIEQKIAAGKQSVRVETSDGQVLTAELIVGADGANSWLRKQAKIELNSWAYNQTAVVCTVHTSESHQDTCWQQFMPEGPLAFLPLHDGQSAIVWSTSEQRAQALINMDEALFNQELQAAFGSSLGVVQVSSVRSAFPLRLRHAKHYVQEHLALIGDAAHTVHPLAGQGVNLGLLDAVVLAEEIIMAHEKNRSLSSLSMLRRYERRRKTDNIAMLAAMDLFKRLFSNDSMPFKILRNTGLNLSDKFVPFKNNMIKRAMGLSGLGLNDKLPYLARTHYNIDRNL